MCTFPLHQNPFAPMVYSNLFGLLTPRRTSRHWGMRCTQMFHLCWTRNIPPRNEILYRTCKYTWSYYTFRHGAVLNAVQDVVLHPPGQMPLHSASQVLYDIGFWHPLTNIVFDTNSYPVMHPVHDVIPVLL